MIMHKCKLIVSKIFIQTFIHVPPVAKNQEKIRYIVLLRRKESHAKGRRKVGCGQGCKNKVGMQTRLKSMLTGSVVKNSPVLVGRGQNRLKLPKGAWVNGAMRHDRTSVHSCHTNRVGQHC